MGTSSMYTGYSSRNSQGNPLLPNDFDENGDNENGDNENGDNENGDNENENNDNNLSPKENSINDKNVSWQTAKTYMSKFANGNSSANKAVSKYVKAYGGAKKASKTSKAGIGTIINIGQFINSVSSLGYNQTLENYNIEYKNKSAKEVLSELINYLAPSPITKEDSIARKALVVTMEALYELFEQESSDIDKINIESLNFIIPKYVENYIYERIINDLGSRIETTSLNSTQVIKIEQEIKDYINAKVDIAFRERDFEKMSFNKNEVENLFNQCYTIMENMI